MITLIIGKKGKTELALESFLNNDNTYYISNNSSLNNTNIIIKNKLNREFPEEKQSKFFYVFNLTFEKVRSIVNQNLMRNGNVVVDANLLDETNLKVLKHFALMSNVHLIITQYSALEEEIRVIKF